MEVVRSGREWYEVVSEWWWLGERAVSVVFLVYLSSLSGLEVVYLCGRSECVGWRVLRVCLVVESSIEGVVVLWE